MEDVALTLTFADWDDWLASVWQGSVCAPQSAPNSRVAEAARVLWRVLARCDEAVQPANRQAALARAVSSSPLADAGSRERIESPSCRASPSCLGAFLSMSKKRLDKASVLRWPFWLTRRSPAILFPIRGQWSALVRAPLLRKDPVMLVRNCPGVRLLGACDLLDSLASIHTQIRQWMMDLFLRKLPVQSACALFDAEAVESQTYQLWRQMHGATVESAAVEAATDLRCDIWQ